MNTKNGVFFVIFLISVYICYVAQAIVWTFFLSMVFAYLLEPIVSKISQKTNINFSTSASIVFLFFFTIFIVILSLMLPALYKQSYALIQKIPMFQNMIQHHIKEFLSKNQDHIDPSFAQYFQNMTRNILANIDLLIKESVSYLWKYFLSTLFILSLIFLFPILLFYYLKDWRVITTNIKSILSKLGFDRVNTIIKDVDILISAYFKGVLSVCIYLSTFYVLSLWMLGFEFFVIIGVASGFSILLPYFGPIFMGLITLSLAYLENGLSTNLFLIGFVYSFAQIVEGYFLTPKIVGNKIGLHPLVIIFVVFIFYTLLGIKGILLAVPTTGVLKIILKNILKI